jgi:hypothetical protein
MKSGVLAWTLVAGLAVPAGWALAQTQSLGELARKTREEREKMAKKPTRVYTNADFPEPEPPPPSVEETETEGRPGSEARSTAGRQPEGDRTRADWERLFRAARANLRATQEIRDLVEDELNLLRIQRARELAPTGQAELDEQINAKLADLETRRRAAAEAQESLEDLEKEFEESGAPEDWLPPDDDAGSPTQS